MLHCKNWLPSEISCVVLLRHLLHGVKLVLLGCMENANAYISVWVNCDSRTSTIWMEHLGNEAHFWRHVGEVVREGQHALVEAFLKWGTR